MLERAIMAVLAGLCAGCATTPAPVASADGGSVGQTVAADDPVVRTVQTIETIGALEAEGAIAAADYLDGVRALRSAGARQSEDAPDEAASLETRWLAAARALDPSANIPPMRGRVLGPSYQRGTVAAGSAKVTTQLYLAGKKAKVALAGQGPAAARSGLRLEIRQSDGKPVCLRPSGSGKTGCEWIPLFSGRYEITVANSGSQPVQFTLVSN
ncbi:hypothetical protein ACFCW2_06890 [Qipengyuania sp. DSG2-2]|uniref:hypothetical protein n=1 Tax=Qipengyuania sp. DGS2-2 TaxID=3349631 RepID=UPI0036D3432F